MIKCDTISIISVLFNLLFKVRSGRRINPKMIKISAIMSNIFLVIGIVFLLTYNILIAMTMFVLSLVISLTIFNTLFRDRKGMRIAINVSFVIVLIAIVFAYVTLTK
jgi:hypothetical protein